MYERAKNYKSGSIKTKKLINENETYITSFTRAQLTPLPRNQKLVVEEEKYLNKKQRRRRREQKNEKKTNKIIINKRKRKKIQQRDKKIRVEYGFFSLVVLF